MKKSAVAAMLILLGWGTAEAQINPYHPPGPGWVIVQPCGQEAQWVPPDHPLATLGVCQVVPNPPVEGPRAPEVLQAGRVYRSRTYHLVIVVTRVTLVENFNWTTLEVERTAEADVTTWQSEDAYRLRQGPVSTGSVNPTDTWQYFEIAR